MSASRRQSRRASVVSLLLVAVAMAVVPCARADDVTATVQRVKGSVVALGTFERTRTPPFQFIATAFVVGDGTLVATNAHALPPALDPAKLERLVIALPQGFDKGQLREAKQVAVDPGSDLALLKIDGAPLPPLRIGDSDTVKEGQEVLFSGFPIGAVLGLFPATHRGIVSAITPIAMPQGRSAELEGRVIRRLAIGSFPVFQLDATAYPGNSGGPVYDPGSGAVLAIINMVFVKDTKESLLKEPSGIGYAVPAKHLQALLQRVR